MLIYTCKPTFFALHPEGMTI